MTRSPLDGLPIRLPAGASDVVVSGPRPFVADIRYSLADGRSVHWQSRALRKAGRTANGRGTTWWIGMLFVIGSACFVLGPIPSYVSLVGGQAAAVTFFVGSLFFTTASYLSYVQVVREGEHRWFGWMPRHIGFWATLIQLVGTLFFNATTFRSLSEVPADMANQVIWRPDVLGSACFLIASAIAFAEAGHRWWSWRPGQRDWHITALNLWGSVFFGLSAIGAFVEPSGSPRNAEVANAGTLLGAVCFLIASLLMMGEGRAAPANAVG